MKLLPAKLVSLFVVAALGVIALWASGSINWMPVLMFSSGILVLSPVADRVRFESIAAQRVALVVFVWVLSLLIWLQGFTQGLISVTLLLQAYRVGVMRSPKQTATEDLQIIAISFLHLIVSTIFSSDISFAGLFVAYLIFMPAALLFSHVVGEKQEDTAHTTIPLGFMGQNLFFAFGIFMFSTLLFFLFPRVQVSLFAMGQEKKSVSGFSEKMSFGSVSNIQEDPSIALRVFMPHTSNDVSFYLKGIVYDRYDGVSWKHTLGEARQQPVNRYLFLHGRPYGAEAVIRISTEEPGRIFLPRGTLALEFPVAQQSVDGSDRKLTLRDGDIEVHDDRPVEYLVHLKANVHEPALLNGQNRDALLHIPPGHDAWVDEAKNVAGDTTHAPNVAQKMVAHFWNNYRYSLSFKNTKAGKDALPLMQFHTNKVGYCEHFASAMVLMLRSRGIPSRVAGGFLKGRWNSYGSYYAVRQADAHSWVEYVHNGHWNIIDPTPPAQRPRGLGDETQDMWDAVRTAWRSWIVEYDGQKQSQAAHALRQSVRSTMSRSSEYSFSSRAILLLLPFAALMLWWLFRGQPKVSIATACHLKLVPVWQSIPHYQHIASDNLEALKSTADTLGHGNFHRFLLLYSLHRFSNTHVISDTQLLAAYKLASRELSEMKAPQTKLAA